MYIIEKIIKIYLKIKNKDKQIISVNTGENIELEDIVTCNHNFMPIDSTGEIFVCSKCGYVVTKERLKKEKNIFKKI